MTKIKAIVEDNISDEHFGVSELARETGMSRSNLLRRVKNDTGLSVSQFIRQVRLERALETLRGTASNISEVAYQVGFSSPSYFIKCFREHYGYSPGEVGKRDKKEAEQLVEKGARRHMTFTVLVVVLAAAAGGIFFWWVRPQPARPQTLLEKSIAVLPFKNESNDSTNLYLINGLMESTLNNLQKIQDLRVISRTSTEKYRNSHLSIPEMGSELNVSYFVEGSGQKIGDKILLNVQLIEAASDRHLWAKQYRREAKDIFDLQQEVAKNIAVEIQAIITPDEANRIAKAPTNDPVAYDFFLKGRELFYQSTRQGLEASIPYFEKAVELDNEFALAYANAAMVHFYLDVFNTEKKYGHKVKELADKALEHDPSLSESLLARAVWFMQNHQYELAVPYLEKALEFNPNSGIVLHFLAEFYFVHSPNTAKYLEYSLMKVGVDVGADATTKCYNYLQLSNAFIQAGFYDEAVANINKSLQYDEHNVIAGYVKAFIQFAKNKDLPTTLESLMEEYRKDTSNVSLLQEIGKLHYLMGDNDQAYGYFKKFLSVKEALKLNLFEHENLKIGIVYAKAGERRKSAELIDSFREYMATDGSIYQHLHQFSYYAYLGDSKRALEHLRLFSEQDYYHWWVLLLELDPLVDPLRDSPEFKMLTRKIEDKFWRQHEEIEQSLKAKGLL